jgi:hypothetical protein
VENLDAVDFLSLGPALECDEHFPSRVNASFVEVGCSLLT